MKLYSIIVIVVLFLSSSNLFSKQMKPIEVDSQIVESVKKDIWIPFMECHRNLDSKKLISIHTADVTRVSINSNKIESGTSYLANINSLFERVKKMNKQMDIQFSIVSSATSANKVFQTGYYKFSSRTNDNEPFQIRGYSFFSVILTKNNESESWKISLDIDKQVELTQEEFMKSGTIYKLD